ncbi:MAG TPA: ribulose-phosphate 3-epimerase [Candidatus Syntrophosphaera sp.]|nr:ribulose-phosphate 3-epimerase [Candidatus Syntrophosphaera sp.]
MIAPSVLSCDFGRLREEIAAVESADVIHLDIMDGHYVPNLTFGYVLLEKIRSLTSLPLDAHLMVTNPASYVERLAKIGVDWISFHQECEFHSHRLVQRIKELGVKAGLALNPAVPLSTLECILPDLDYVLLMSVNPGFSGQSFIPAALEKVRALRNMIDTDKMAALIEIDGGVNCDNAARIRDAGADILVSASYIFGSSNYAAAIKSLRG